MIFYTEEADGLGNYEFQFSFDKRQSWSSRQLRKKKLRTNWKQVLKSWKKTKGNLEAQGSLTRSSFRSEKKLSSQLSEKGNCFAKKSHCWRLLLLLLLFSWQISLKNMLTMYNCWLANPNERIFHTFSSKNHPLENHRNAYHFWEKLNCLNFVNCYKMAMKGAEKKGNL